MEAEFECNLGLKERRVLESGYEFVLLRPLKKMPLDYDSTVHRFNCYKTYLCVNFYFLCLDIRFSFASLLLQALLLCALKLPLPE